MFTWDSQAGDRGSRVGGVHWTRRAKTTILKLSQRESLAGVFSLIQQGKPLPRGHCLRHYIVDISQDGLLLVTSGVRTKTDESQPFHLKNPSLPRIGDSSDPKKTTQTWPAEVFLLRNLSSKHWWLGPPCLTPGHFCHSLTIGELVGHNVLSCFLGVVDKSEIQPIALVMRRNDENLLARFDWKSISCLSRSHETVRQETWRAGLEVSVRVAETTRSLEAWRPKPPEFGKGEFLRRKISAGQVSGVFLGSDESPLRGREEFCDVLHSVEDELLELGWSYWASVRQSGYLTRHNSLRWAPESERQGKWAAWWAGEQLATQPWERSVLWEAWPWTLQTGEYSESSCLHEFFSGTQRPNRRVERRLRTHGEKLIWREDRRRTVFSALDLM